MIPDSKEEDTDPAEFQHDLKFSLFGRTFSLSLSVIKKKE